MFRTAVTLLTFVRPPMLLALILGGCQMCGTTDDGGTLPKSMKGYELYSWQTQGKWFFSLLPGTNRLKTADEVTSADVRVEGTGAIETELGKLATGESVFWSAKRVAGMSMPDEQTRGTIASYCDQIGVNLVIDQ